MKIYTGNIKDFEKKTLFMAVSITALFVVTVALVQKDQSFQTQKTKASDLVGCDAHENGVTFYNRGAGRNFDLRWFAHYCDKAQHPNDCFCSGGEHFEEDIFIPQNGTLTRGFDNKRPMCEWTWQTDCSIFYANEDAVQGRDGANGCGSEPCPASCESMSIQPNPFEVGQDVTFSCNVKDGVGKDKISGYSFNVNGIRYPTATPGWGKESILTVKPTKGGQVWCGAITEGGTIVGGKTVKCTADLVVKTAPTPTPSSSQCNALYASPNPFYAGDNVTFTCDVTSGTGQNTISGYSFNVNGVRYPISSYGWQASNVLNVVPKQGGEVWCGALTVGGAIVGGRTASCTTNLTMLATPTPTPVPTPVCIVSYNMSNYGQTSADFTIRPIKQEDIDMGGGVTEWRKTWEISGKPGAKANIELVSYGCEGMRSPTKKEICEKDRATTENWHYLTVTIPASGSTTFTVTDEVDCCGVNQTDLKSVIGKTWGSSFFVRYAEAPYCTYN